MPSSISSCISKNTSKSISKIFWGSSKNCTEAADSFVCMLAALKIVVNLSLSSCSSFLSNLVDTGKEDKNGNVEPNYFYLWCSSSVISNIRFHLKWCFENISCKVFINELHKLMPRCLFVGLSRDGDCSLLAASLYLLGGNTLPLDCFFFILFLQIHNFNKECWASIWHKNSK